MANIFYDADGAFSGLTPKKIVAGAFAPALNGTYEALNTTRYQAFTASEGGSCIGAIVNVASTFAILTTTTYTVTLQENTGSWVDRATKTLTWADIVGSHSTSSNKDTHSLWAFFEFTSPYTIDTTGSKWRISIAGSAASALIVPTYGYGIVISGTTTYNSGDNIVTKQNSTITIDQSITAAALCTGAGTHIVWDSTPSSSFTLTITDFYYGTNTRLEVGDSLNRIPYAQQAIIAITNWRSNPYNGYGENLEVQIYGEKPTSYYTTIASNFNASQAIMTTSDNMSATWVGTDSIVVSGINHANGGQETKAISTISGTSVTMSTNFSYAHLAGWWVLNYTRAAKCGVTINGLFYSPTSNCNSKPVVLKLSGVNVTGNIVSNRFYNGTITGTTTFDTTRKTAQIFDCIVIPDYSITHTFCDIITDTGSGFTDIYMWRTSGTPANSISTSLMNLAGVYVTGNVTVNGVYTAHYYGSSSRGWLTIVALGWTLQNIMLCGAYAYGDPGYQISGLTLTSCTITNFKTLGGATSIYGALNACTITNWTTEYSQYCWYLSGSSVGNIFTSCQFNQIGASISAGRNILFAYNYADPLFNDCKFESDKESSIANAITGSSLRAHNYGDTDINDNRSYYIYGKMYSTGDALTDTTVHTAGTGKYALRFEPTSSATNLDWSFVVPTGNIQNKTMTVALWCKINNANYYSGTYQLPRLTINYDNGTTAYCQAATSTDWQQLFVTFVPTTTYGQITVTLSGRTDQTTTNAYVYWDDMGLLYPANNSLDLGGMDNWANALPVTPPVAIPISAYTVSSAVWEELTSSHTTTGSMGKKLGDMTAGASAADVADAVWDEATSGHVSAGTFGEKIGKKLLTLAKFIGLK